MTCKVGPQLGGGWFQVLVWTQVSTALGDFVTLRLMTDFFNDSVTSSPTQSWLTWVVSSSEICCTASFDILSLHLHPSLSSASRLSAT